MPQQPRTRAPVLADLAARHGAPHELTARQDAPQFAGAPVGATAIQYVIDVSEWQGVVDMGAVRDAGVPAAIAKTNEGTYVDPFGQANLANARAAGLIRGAYTYLTHGSSVATQVATFLRLAPHDAIHALDVEAPGPLDPRAWVEEYRRHEPTHPLAIYTGKYMWSQRSQVAYPGGDLGPLWNAGAVPGGYVPGVDETPATAYARVGTQNGGLPYQGWDTWTLLQFSESCRVPGVPGRVDASAFRGTLDQLRALTGQETDMPLTADDIGKVADATAQKLLGTGLYRDHDPYDTTKPLTVMRVLDELMRRSDDPVVLTPATVQALAATLGGGLVTQITAALQALPAGTATLDDATIGRLADTFIDKLNARLVR